MRPISLRLGPHAVPARVAATVAFLVGLASLSGWGFGIQVLTSLIPGAAEMKANTAVGMILSASALLILADHAALSLDRAAQILAGAVLLLGLATLAEYIVGRNFGIDEFVIRDTIGAFNAFHGRMSPATATAFVGIGTALSTLRYRRLDVLTKCGAGSAAVLGVISIIGYAWNARELTTDTVIPPMALNTAACFAFLGIGVLIAPRRTVVPLNAQIRAMATIEIKVMGSFLIALTLLLGGGSYIYRSNVRAVEANARVAHTQAVRAALADVSASLAAAELMQRNYVNTSDERRRNEYERLVGTVQQRLAELVPLTSDNPVQQIHLSELHSEVLKHLLSMEEALRAFSRFGPPSARAVDLLAQNIDGVQNVRLIAQRMDATEIGLLGQRQSFSDRQQHATLVSLLITLGVSTVLFVALFRGINLEMRRRQEAENALLASEQYNRSIVDSSPDCLAILSPDGRLNSMTPQGRRMMDVVEFSSIANMDWINLWKDPDRTAARSSVETARQGTSGRFQGYCATQTGIPKWWDVIVMPILGADGTTDRLLAVARDITETKRTENSLLEANRFLDLLFENLPLMVVVKDAKNLSFVRQNRACEQLLGLTREELTGKTARDLFTAEEADLIVAQDRAALASGGLVKVSEQAVKTPHLGVRTFQTMKMPLGERNDEPQFLLAISVDVTEQKLAETAIRQLNTDLQAKATQLEITNKELESFSYSVSHDLRAPLRAIDGFASMIEEDYKPHLGPEGQRYLAVIRENSRRMGALIDDLLAFSQLGRLPVAVSETDVHALVHEALEEVMAEHERRPQIIIGTLPPVLADRALLRQVWINLISNAVKYSSKSDSPVIEIQGEQNDAETVYSVRDNGVGFDMQYVQKLFGVFQRLHRVDEFGGTGIGLAIVHRVVTRHGGRVWADGRVNDGAVFSFALPRHPPRTTSDT